MRWSGHVACIGQKTNAYSVLVGKHEGKRPLGRPRRRRQDNIKANVQEIEWGGVECVCLRIGTREGLL
jgi:hypothetical protein